MADTLTTTTTVSTIPSGSIIATDDAGVGGHVQIVKLALSADGSASPITADANGLEVQGAGVAGTPAGGVVSVQGVASGTALPISAASLPLPSGASTLAEQQTQTTHLATIAGTVSGTEVQVDVVAALPAGSNTIGGAIPRPTTSGGLDIFRSLDIDETEEEVKATAGQLYGYYFSNAATSMRFLKFYNATAVNVTVGTTTPVLTLGLPASSAGHIEWAHGIAFGTAITVAATTAVADADTGAPSANDVVINVFYK